MPITLGFVSFTVILTCFVARIICLIFHNSLFSLFLGWDGLGITSYYLVYYYRNWRSMNGAIVTLLTNRLGDVFLFFSLIYFYFLRIKLYYYIFIFLFLIICAITKRAQFPFRSWLPLAMRAPTPVSSLVHSSTLVTAGVFLLYKYYYFFINSITLVFCLLLGLVTRGFSRFLAMLEQDIKKLVALSTLSQIGFLFFIMGLGLPTLIFLHLLTHAFFKSCLFLQVGVFIHWSFSLQDTRGYRSSYSLRNFNSLVVIRSLFRICGILFTRGFIRKDIIISAFCFSWFSLIFLSLVFLVILFTYLYSFQIISMLVQPQISSFRNSNQGRNLVKIFRIVLFFLGLQGGWIILGNFDNYPLLISVISKSFPLLCIVLFLIVFRYFNFVLESYNRNMGGISAIFFLPRQILHKFSRLAEMALELEGKRVFSLARRAWRVFLFYFSSFSILLLVFIIIFLLRI